jgi:uncharacterized protein YidB (DUF937 family)
MGLFDSIAGQVAGALTGQGGNAAGNAGLIQAVISVINSPQIGGIPGLIAAFQQKGLGDIIASWIGTGSNLPISAGQLESVLGSEQIGGMAQKLGLSSQEVSGQLSSLLPQLVDKISPTGAAPDGDALQQAMGMLGSFLK